MHCFKAIHYIESIQYKIALAITTAIRGTSRKKIYSELGLESLQDRRWYRKLSVFYKILNTISPIYLRNVLPSNNIPLLRVNNN